MTISFRCLSFTLWQPQILVVPPHPHDTSVASAYFDAFCSASSTQKYTVGLELVWVLTPTVSMLTYIGTFSDCASMADASPCLQPAGG